jgi:hypothetical protein
MAPSGPGEELILIPHAQQPMALLRRDAVEPEVFTFRAGARVALDSPPDRQIPAALLANSTAGAPPAASHG